MYRRNSNLRARLLRDGGPGASPETSPIGGGAATATTEDEPKKPDTGDGKDEETLGENGLKALRAERERGDRLEKELKELAPLREIAAALGGGNVKKGKSELEQLSDRLANHEQELATERQARWRAELAHEHGLTPAQAKRLIGATREEMAADAAELVKDFGVDGSKKPDVKRPKPDRSQGGAPGGSVSSGKAEGLAEAKRRFGDRTKTNT